MNIFKGKITQVDNSNTIGTTLFEYKIVVRGQADHDNIEFIDKMVREFKMEEDVIILSKGQLNDLYESETKVEYLKKLLDE